MTVPQRLETYRVEAYIAASGALADNQIRPYPILEAMQNVGAPREEMLLLHALRSVNSLHNIHDVQDVGSAYWYWVKQLTVGEIAQRRGKHSNWHESRVESAQDTLSKFARKSDFGEGVLRSARQFFGGRSGHKALVI